MTEINLTQKKKKYKLTLKDKTHEFDQYKTQAEDEIVKLNIQLAKSSEHDGNFNLMSIGKVGGLSDFKADFRVDNDDKLSRFMLRYNAQNENMTVTIIVTDGKGNVIDEKKYSYYEERERNITVLGSWIVVRSGLMLFPIFFVFYER